MILAQILPMKGLASLLESIIYLSNEIIQQISSLPGSSIIFSRVNPMQVMWIYLGIVSVLFFLETRKQVGLRVLLLSFNFPIFD